ncbi:M48 family metallopeptidase [Deinococcus taklimakanensis]|uniref:M48 family metallopeptidase n=1 Tax=Deinococcus taklimakanensis TaxID=536443 RepID=A0ABW5NYD2_9DEIO
MEWPLHLHDLEFTVRESSRRKTVSLGIERDGRLLILAPQGTSRQTIEEFVRSRLGWVYGKLSRKTDLYRPAPLREYVDGEGFLYAGRSYRLHRVNHSADGSALKLAGQWFELLNSEVERGREHFIAWYTAQLEDWAQQQVIRLAPRLRRLPVNLRVTELGDRWGAASRTKSVTLHWRVALLPRRIAEYVLVHELVHLEFHHHRAEFWQRLEVMLPDYIERKSWLALHGADYDL